jgi:hypothetical protein
VTLTRVVRVQDVVPPAAARNEATRHGPAPRALEPGRIAERFAKVQRAMAEDLAQKQSPGLFAFAASAQGLVGATWVAAEERSRVCTVGRHSACDLWLRPADLALRHLAVVIRAAGGGVEHRVIDLRTSPGFLDEHGVPQRCLIARGPHALEVADLVLFLIPSGAGVPWEPLAPNPWEGLVDSRGAEHRAVGTSAPSRGEGALRCVREEGETWLRVAPAPLAPLELVGNEQAEGTLILADRTQRELHLAIGERALVRGVLLGRYDRCDGAAVLSHPNISRVHALLLREAGALMLFDLSSTNGLYRGEEEGRQFEVEPELEYRLAGEVAVCWRPSGVGR